MSKKTETTTNGGVGFFGLLTILFIGLKLAGHIAWSWWWVFSPLWLPFVVLVSIMLIVAVFAALTGRL